MKEKIGRYGRYAACILLVVVFFLLYELRLFQWQVLEGEHFAELARSDRTDVIELDPARGQILDRNGKVLAGNRTTYDVVYDALKMDYSRRNATILEVIDLLEEQGEKWLDMLPIEVNPQEDEEDDDSAPTYRYLENKDAEIRDLKELLNLAEYATADQCVAELADMFGFQGFSTEDTRTVASVRYGMVQTGYSRTSPYVFAQDVSAETVGIISQRADKWPGVEGRVSVARTYGEESNLAPHVIGKVRIITAEQLDAAIEAGTAYDYENYSNISGYKYVDVMGEWGLESAFESTLRGQRGEQTIYTDDDGDVIRMDVTTSPVEGRNVVTTLDTDLQRAANLSLARNIQANTNARNCRAGAAVVIDVKDFGVLACANYPSYDLENYEEDYQKLSEDTRAPLFNKALQGSYVPGSIFKPLVALASLQEGVISAGTTYYCNHLFEYGDGDGAMQLGCICPGGNRDVYSGIAQSCNVYFCNVGLDLGIKRMDAYAEYFGLGQRTGVELTESSGLMTGRQEYLENHGVDMPEGVTAQAAIGQADNMFTPIQMATYCATLANNGKRLKTHFLKEITDYNGEEVLEKYQPTTLFDAELSMDVVNIVRQGMIDSASIGTGSDVFGSYPVAVACKTGTAETSGDDTKEPNLTFICMAPAYDPQIAVAVMLEEGNKGSWAKYVAKDILDQYFGYYTWDADGNRYDQEGNMVDEKGEILRKKEDLDREKEEQEQREQQQYEEQLGGDTPSPGPTPEATAAPSPSPTPARGGEDIPSTPFTGESPTPLPEASQPPEQGPTRPPDSPYYLPESSG